MQTEHLETELLTRLMRKVGFYSWSITHNIITADKMFAEIYEIDEVDLARGVSVEYILSLIVEEDRARLAERIHDVLLGGPPAVSGYRILCPSGQYKSLLSIGSCSRDEDGIPAIYSGIVMTAQDTEAEVNEVQLQKHISAAIELAQKSGNALTERYLNSALRSVAKSDQ
ncbi:PAS domain-containing protein [Agrobacterium sp. rho-13.3]|jgi:PAS domain-containing protein|uniref:PAS domain-containing protein n=1 Tax=Agrobacterium sp. rho-13.3 TaxID=3072980 RepID=UPI002A1227D5|nr:PAS domain-containing protein [Agrobacterium sp. rho-13.3]MDX8309133.1 PAS domain-containing protein [Agrobacterium sp. rho-13.3]